MQVVVCGIVSITWRQVEQPEFLVGCHPYHEVAYTSVDQQARVAILCVGGNSLCASCSKCGQQESGRAELDSSHAVKVTFLGGVVNSARVCGWSDWVFDEVQFHAEFHSVCGASSIGPNEVRCDALVHAPPPEKILHLGRARARATAQAPLTSSHSVVDAHSPNGPKTNPARYAGGMRPRRRACWRAAVTAAPESCRLRLRAQLLDFALGRRTDVLFAFGTIDSVILKQR